MAITYNPIANGYQQVSTLAWESDLDFTLGLDPSENLVLVADPLRPPTAIEVWKFDSTLNKIIQTDTSINVALQVPRYTVATLPVTGNLVGQMVYTTDDNNLRMWNGSAWVIAVSGSGVAPSDATFVTLSLNGDLTNERVLTAGANISLVDGGANSTVTIAATGLATNTPSFLTLGATADLTNERVLTAGTGITFVDGGAGAALTISATSGFSGWVDDGTVVRLATATDQVAVGTATAVTGYAATIKLDKMLALQAATAPNRQWLFQRENIAGMGSSEMLSIAPDVNDDLKIYLASVASGQRIYIWDDSQTLPNIVSTGLKPTLAIYGDILVGDIDALGSNPFTVFRRPTTGLAASAVTQLFSAQNGVNDTDGGAGFILAPSTGAADSDGYVESIAYGQGSGALANSILFTTRSGAGAVTRRWQLGGPGNVGDLVPFASNTYRLGTLTTAPKSLSGSAGTGTGTGHAIVVLNQDTAGGTGCPADTVENDLKTYTLPGNSLATDGDLLRVTMSFRCDAGVQNKRIRIYFGGTVLLDSSAIANTNQIFNVQLYITRTGATAQYCQGAIIGTATHNVWSTALNGDCNFPSDPGKTLSSDQIIKATVQQGAVAAVNAVIQDMMIVEYLRKA